MINVFSGVRRKRNHKHNFVKVVDDNPSKHVGTFTMNPLQCHPMSLSVRAEIAPSM